MKPGEQRQIGNIRNYYGALSLRKTEDGYQWSIENWDGQNWENIPDYLAEALLRYEDE